MFKMICVKRIILLFVILHTIYYVSTGAEFDSTVNNDVIANQYSNSSEISDTCDTITCHNGGECKIVDSNPVCECTEEFKGDNCEIFKCDKIICHNGGKCNIVDENPVCDCTKEYMGDSCEILSEDACNERFPNCIQTGGSCVSDGKAEISCKCPSQISYVNGIGCKTSCDKNSNSCKNGGTCDEDEKVCICKERTHGHLCEIVDDCENNSTFCGDEMYSRARCVFDQQENKAVCKCNNKKLKLDENRWKCRQTCDNFNSNCENGGGCEGSEMYKFCNCKKGTSGDHCEIIDACKGLSCRKETTVCSYDTMTETAFCNCTDSKQRYDVGKNDCILFDGCLLKMIRNECSRENEVCEEGECKCKENYKYSDDKNVCEEDKCASCPIGSVCNENTDYSCRCKDGEYSDGIICVKYSKCEIGISKCQQKCNVNTGKCACEKGFNLSPDNVSCETTDEFSTCVVSHCYPGICVERDGKKTCICPETTHKSVNNSCIDICTLSKGKPPKNMNCPKDMKCESVGDRGIRCKCEDPYEQADDGIHCKRKQMCEEQKVIEELEVRSALCREIETGKGYELYCDKPFKFDKNGVCKRKCEFKEGECLKKFAVCELDENYNAVCRCPVMLKKNVKDGSCTETAKASYSGKMTFMKSKYVIENERYQRRKISTDLVESTHTVQLKKDLKASVKYVYGDNVDDVKILEDCEPFENFLECQIELQLKNEPSDVNVLTSSSYCYIIDEGFCLVNDLVVKREKSSNLFKQTDICTLGDIFCDDSTKCTPDYSKNTLKCACREGFKFIRSIPILNEGNSKDICEDIDECQKKTHKCPENTTCINTYGSYKCECDTGFRRKAENLDPKKHGCEAVCDPNPCKNRGECVQKINRGFICTCKPMYTGTTCNETVTGKEDGKCVSIIGSLIGTAVVLFFIIAVIVVVVLRKMKIIKNDDDDCSRCRQQFVSRDVIQVERKENEYVEINLHSNSRQHRPNNVEMRQVNIMPRVSIIPRAHLSRDNSADEMFEDRCSTYDVPRKYSDIRSEEDKLEGSTMEYPNKAYGLEE